MTTTEPMTQTRSLLRQSRQGCHKGDRSVAAHNPPQHPRQRRGPDAGAWQSLEGATRRLPTRGGAFSELHSGLAYASAVLPCGSLQAAWRAIRPPGRRCLSPSSWTIPAMGRQTQGGTSSGQPVTPFSPSTPRAYGGVRKERPAKHSGYTKGPRNSLSTAPRQGRGRVTSEPRAFRCTTYLSPRVSSRLHGCLEEAHE